MFPSNLSAGEIFKPLLANREAHLYQAFLELRSPRVLNCTNAADNKAIQIKAKFVIPCCTSVCRDVYRTYTILDFAAAKSKSARTIWIHGLSKCRTGSPGVLSM